MRDDIHKSAPLNSAWRRFLKRCVREADRGDRAAEAAADATASDCRKEISYALLAAVVEKCDSGQSDLFGSNLAGIVCGAEDGVLGQSFVDRLRLAEMDGALTRKKSEAVLAATLAERIEDRRRAMIGHILKEGGHGSSECVAAIKGALGKVSAAAYAKQIIAEGDAAVAAKLKLATPVLTLDEKLN